MNAGDSLFQVGSSAGGIRGLVGAQSCCAPPRSSVVDVWRAKLDGHPPAVVEHLHALLSRDERERAARFYFERDRRRFIVARGVLRTLLAQYVGGAPEGIAFRYGAQGKPALIDDALRFNLAHSDDLALFAFTPAAEVGIDVERVRELPDWESLAEHSFSACELERLRACPPEQQRGEFFRAWTRQEAILKALGTGLGGPTAGDADAFDVWPLDLGPEFAAALAVVKDRRPEIKDQSLTMQGESRLGLSSFVSGPWTHPFS